MTTYLHFIYYLKFNTFQYEARIILDSKIIGSCLCTAYHNGRANILIIDNVQVDPEYRHKGYGTKLLELVMNDSIQRNLDCIELAVDKDNENGIKLYEKVGFGITNKNHCRKILNHF